MASLDLVCAAFGVPESVPATEALEVAAADLVARLPETIWDQWPPEARTAAKFAIRYDAVALLNELQGAIDAGELEAFLSDTPEPGGPRWAGQLVGRADRAERAKHDEGLRNHASANALASIALDALKTYAARHPERPASRRPDV